MGFHESCHKFEMLAGIDILDLREWTKKRQQEDRISSAEDQTTLVIPGEWRDSEDEDRDYNIYIYIPSASRTHKFVGLFPKKKFFFFSYEKKGFLRKYVFFLY